MNEILDRIAAALEKQTDLLTKSVELQEEGCMRNREKHALDYEHYLLSIERHYLLRLKELLGFFAIGGAERVDIFPVIHAAYEKWKQSVEDISPEANIGFNIIERIYENDLKVAKNQLLKDLDKAGTVVAAREIKSVLEVINDFSKKRKSEKEETRMQNMTLNFVQDLLTDEPPRSPATWVDFGIPSGLNPQYGALQWGLKNKMFTALELGQASGSGPKLTELASRGDNPYKCEFHTLWDDMPPEEDENEDEIQL